MVKSTPEALALGAVITVSVSKGSAIGASEAVTNNTTKANAGMYFMALALIQRFNIYEETGVVSSLI